MDPNSAEYIGTRNFLELVTNLPWKNEEFKVVEIVTDSAGNKWAKLDDNTYFAIVYDGEALASKVE